MKRFITIMLTAFVAVMECEAQFVSEQQAQERVREFFAGSMPANARGRAVDGRSLTLAYQLWDETSQSPSVYVFNQQGDGGFIIASADERTAPVLGYADTGCWDAGNMPEALLQAIADYGNVVRETRRQPSTAAARRAANYDDSWTVVKPLIKTKWGQGAPYNNLCPIWNGRRCITGCVATAFAQIMYYHQWPKRGLGRCSYTTKNGLNCSADFGSTTYQWDKMRLKYSSNDYDEDDAVATLMYHCGVAHNMQYSPNESWGYFNWWWEDDRRMSEIVKYFDYEYGVWGMMRNNVSELQFATTIYNNLKQGLPVLYNATPDKGSAHVYVCDGYDGNGFFHINWGWNGNGDGNFLLTDMNTYNNNRIILYNIKPSEKTASAMHATTTDNNVQQGMWNLRGQRVAQGSRPKGVYVVKSADGKPRKMVTR